MIPGEEKMLLPPDALPVLSLSLKARRRRRKREEARRRGGGGATKGKENGRVEERGVGRRTRKREEGDGAGRRGGKRERRREGMKMKRMKMRERRYLLAFERRFL